MLDENVTCKRTGSVKAIVLGALALTIAIPSVSAQSQINRPHAASGTVKRVGRHDSLFVDTYPKMGIMSRADGARLGTIYHELKQTFGRISNRDLEWAIQRMHQPPLRNEEGTKDYLHLAIMLRLHMVTHYQPGQRETLYQSDLWLMRSQSVRDRHLGIWSAWLLHDPRALGMFDVIGKSDPDREVRNVAEKAISIWNKPHPDYP